MNRSEVELLETLLPNAGQCERHLVYLGEDTIDYQCCVLENPETHFCTLGTLSFRARTEKGSYRQPIFLVF